MFIPVMVVFFFFTSLPDSLPDEKKKCLFLVSLAVMAVLTVCPGASVGFVSGSSTYMDSLALSAYLPGFISPLVGILLTITLVLFLSWLCLQISRGYTSLLKQSLVFFVFFLLTNNICGYIACNTHKDINNYGSDAVQMNTNLETQPDNILIITQQHYNETLSYCLESRLRKPYQQVTIDAMAAALSETDGIYTPFIPDDQDPNINNHLTPDTDHFLKSVIGFTGR